MATIISLETTSGGDNFVKIDTAGTDISVAFKCRIAVNNDSYTFYSGDTQVPLFTGQFSDTTVLPGTSGDPASQKLADMESYFFGLGDDGGGGNVVVTNTPLPVAIGSTVNISDVNALYDTTGRLMVNIPGSQFEARFNDFDQSHFFEKIQVGTGTVNYDQNNACMQLDVSAPGDIAILRTRQRGGYQTGKPFRIPFTALFNIPADTEVFAGYYDSEFVADYNVAYDGFGIRKNGTTLAIEVHANGNIMANVPQASWDDPLDGSGASGYTLNWDKDNYFEFEFLWLGAAGIRFSIIKSDGNRLQFHELNFANQNNFSFMRTPNHSFRIDLRSTGGVGSVRLFCLNFDASVIEGVGYGRAARTNAITALSSNVKYGVLGIRYKQISPATSLSGEFMSAIIRLTRLFVMGTSNDNFRYEVQINPTLSGALTWTDIPNSCLQGGISATNRTVTVDGEIIARGLLNAGTTSALQDGNLRKLGVLMASATSEEIVICVTPLSASGDVEVSLNWDELI